MRVLKVGLLAALVGGPFALAAVEVFFLSPAAGVPLFGEVSSSKSRSWTRLEWRASSSW